MTATPPAKTPRDNQAADMTGPDSAAGPVAVSGIRSLLLFARRSKALRWLAGLAACYCLLVGLVAPRLVKPAIEAELSRALRTPCTIGSLRVNPLTLNAVARNVVILHPGGVAPGDLLRLRRVEARLDLSSLSRGSLVISNALCDRPELHLNRDADETFSLSHAATETDDLFPLVIHDLTVRNGTLVFTDGALGKTLTVTDIALTLPFFSTRKTDTETPLLPVASATVNGDRVTVGGELLLFAPSRRMHLTLDAPRIDLVQRRHLLEPYTSLVPRSGILAVQTWLDFAREGEDTTLTVGGTARVTGLVLEGPQGLALALPRAQVAVERLDLHARRAVIKSITLEKPSLTVRRARDGSLDWPSFTRGLFPKSRASAEWTLPQGFVVHSAIVTGGSVTWHDDAAQPPTRHTLTDIALSLAERYPEDGGHAAFTAGFGGLAEGFRVTATGEATTDPPVIEADIHAENLPLTVLGHRLAAASGLTPDKGVVRFQGKVTLGLTPAPFARLADGTLTVTDARLRAPTDTAAPFLTFEHLEAQRVMADTAARRLRIGSLAGKGLALAVTRAANGVFNLPQPVPDSPAAELPAGTTPAPEKAAAPPAWSAAVDALSLTAARVAVTDLSRHNAQPLVLRDITISGKNFVTRGPAQWTARLTGKQGERGNLTLTGKGSLVPPRLTFSGRVESADLRPLSPYLQAVSNLSLTEASLGGDISGSAALAPRSTRGGELTLRGSLGLYGVTLVHGTGEVGGWGRMRLENIVCRLPATGGRSLAVGTVAVNAPRLSVTIDKNGENSLRAAIRPPESPHGPGRESDALTAADNLTVGAITLTQGQATYRDKRLSPPYRLRMDAVTASLRNLSLNPKAESPLTASLNIDGAPVTVEGTISDLFQTPSGKGRIEVGGLDLARLSRYATKYLGYPVKSGELSAESTFSLKGRKLQMQNKIQIRDLELGEKVASPEAADLPLAAAAAILRDRSGVINLDLPVAGTIGDPKFRLGGVTSAVIGNLVLKTVTSPVTLLDSLVSGLGSLFGGDDPKDARIVFRPGSATLTRAARSTLETFATELKRRPGLSLSITGVADTAEKDVVIDTWVADRLRTMKYNALPPAQQAAAKGRVTVSPDHDAGEYANLLFALYKNMPFVKASKDPAVKDPTSTRGIMRILREKMPVTESQLLALANARAEAVRTALTGDDSALAARITLRQGSVLDSTGTGERIASYVRITVGRE